MIVNSGLTDQLASFSAGAHALRIDNSVRRIVKTGFIDTVATMLAGRDEPVVGVMRRFVAARGASIADARVLFSAERVCARDAALINATAGHALDYDDVALRGHPSTVLVPALLAEGERLASGGDALIRAYVVGYETWAELVTRDADLHHLKGWHPTAVFGVIGTAAAVAALRGLDAVLARHSLGIAASLASGLVANFGSMVKPFHAGHAAASGIDAVDLAVLGMTAAPDVLEHHAGFLAALSPAGRMDRQTPAAHLGERLRILESGLSIKKYPLCFAAHRVIDAILDLVHGYELRAEDVREMHATIGIAQASMLRNHAPRTALEAKFSLEFALSAALVAGRVSLAQLDDAFVQRVDVQKLFAAVRISTTDTTHPAEPSLAASDRLVVELRDGRRLDSGEVLFARGDAGLPLQEGDLEAKFLDCTEGVNDIDTRRLLLHLQRLESVDDVRMLAE